MTVSHNSVSQGENREIACQTLVTNLARFLWKALAVIMLENVARIKDSSGLYPHVLVPIGKRIATSIAFIFVVTSATREVLQGENTFALLFVGPNNLNTSFVSFLTIETSDMVVYMGLQFV